MPKSYIKVTEEAAKRFFSKKHSTPIVMMNLLRFKEIADYSTHPHLKSASTISGKEAYQRYMKAVMPMLAKINSEILFSGKTEQFLIGPMEEMWDAILLVRHQNMKDFLAFASNPAYLEIEGHRTAALKDSRLLPILERFLF
ncbi:MAG: DUF1330 domain-containing protein [Bacteroidota bacterium]